MQLFLEEQPKDEEGKSVLKVGGKFMCQEGSIIIVQNSLLNFLVGVQ